MSYNFFDDHPSVPFYIEETALPAAPLVTHIYRRDETSSSFTLEFISDSVGTYHIALTPFGEARPSNETFDASPWSGSASVGSNILSLTGVPPGLYTVWAQVVNIGKRGTNLIPVYLHPAGYQRLQLQSIGDASEVVNSLPELTTNIVQNNEIIRVWGDESPELDSFTFYDNGTAEWREVTQGVGGTVKAQDIDVLNGGVGALVTIATPTALGNQDLLPNPFTFNTQNSVGLSQLITSNTVTISGLNGNVPANITGGEYSKNGAAFATAPFTMTNGDTLTVRTTSSASNATPVVVEVVVGNRTEYFEVITESASSTTPDAFDFQNQTGVAINTYIFSNEISVTGITDAVPISITGSYEYSIDGGAYTSNSGTVNNNQTVRLRVLSSPQANTTISGSVTIGGVSDSISISTAEEDTTPNAIYFGSVIDVEPGVSVISQAQEVTGINAPTAINVTGGEYSINGGSWTSGTGTISALENVRVRITSSNTLGASNTATLIVGGMTATFTVTTTSDVIQPEPGLDPSLPPSGNFNLDAWKLTLPVNKDTYFGSGGSDPAEIIPGAESNPPLNGEFEDVNFFYTAPDGTMVFRTPLNGGSSTPNSSYVRTELRELYDWQSGDSTGDANWLPAGSHLLRARVQVTEYWENDPQTIVGQIHAKDSSKALIKLQWDGPTKPVRAIINEDPSSGNPFSLEFGTPGTSVFEYAISLSDGILAITVDGQTQSVEFGVGGMSSDWNSHEYYFKAGNYAQADKSGGGVFTVKFYELDVIHEAQVDTQPDPFQFSGVTQVALNTPITSSAITPTGYSPSAPISVTGGEYSLNGDDFTSAAGTIFAGQYLRLRVNSAPFPGASRSVSVTIGGVTSTFTVTTAVASDDTPNAFAFIPQSGLDIGTETFSNEVVISGINAPAEIFIDGGEYSIDGEEFTSANGFITDNQSVVVKLFSPSEYSSSVTATLTVGGVSEPFTVATRTKDITPDAFSLSNVTDLPINTEITLPPVLISGIDDFTDISVVGGEYSSNGSNFTSDPGMVANGSSVVVKATTGESFLTTQIVTLIIGGVSSTATLTTGQNTDTTPEAFSFTDVLDAALGQEVTSDSITVTGIAQDASISVEGGEYSIDGGSFTSATGTVSEGSTVSLRATSSISFGDTVDVTLTIDVISDTFSITTIASDSTPDSFSFSPLVGVPLGSYRESETITLTGINDAATINVYNGEYSLNGAAYTNASGVASEGDTLRVRLISSNSFSENRALSLVVGGFETTFTVTTLDIDQFPDAFSFITITDAPRGDFVISGSQTILGINSPSPISVIGGEYSVNGEAFTEAPSTVVSGDTVRLAVNTEAGYSTDTTATLTIGGRQATFTATTEAATDSTPNQFVFADLSGVGLGVEVPSNAVVVEGTNTQSSISILGGTYSINGAPATASTGLVSPGDSVQVFVTSSGTYGTTAQCELSIGGVVGIFSVTTENADTDPSVFVFPAITDANINTPYLSNTVVISGINTATPISIVGGEYSKNGTAFTSTSGTISEGDTLQLRVYSSLQFDTEVVSTVSVGSVAREFRVSTEEEDSLVDAFDFSDQNSVPLGSLRESGIVTVSGVNTGIPVNIVGGEYRVNGGSYTTLPGVVVQGDTLQVRVLSSTANEATTGTTLSVGSFSTSFSVTTVEAPDSTPDIFTIPGVADVPTGSTVNSDPILIEGINTGAGISVVNGEYSVDGGSFTSLPGTVQLGQSVVVRVTASATPSSSVTAILTVGGVSANFSVHTEGADLTPNSFSFTTQNNANPGVEYESNSVVVTGITTPVPISAIGGEYSLDGGSYSSVASTVSAGQTLRLRASALNVLGASKSIVVTVGDFSTSYTITTLAEDDTVDGFVIPSVTGASLGSSVISDSVNISGPNVPVTVSITGGEYSVDGGPFLTSPGVISSGQGVRVRLTASSDPGTTTLATLTVGGASATFEATTVAVDASPANFTLAPLTGQQASRYVVSAPITISGINVGVPIAVTNGSYRIDGGPFESLPGVVYNGSTVEVRVLSSNTPNTEVISSLTVGDKSSDFSVTTVAASLPNIFIFDDQLGATPGEEVLSNSQTITGLNSDTAISITGGEYRINGGDWTSVNGYIRNQETLELKLIVPNAFSSSATVVVDIAGVAGTFTVTTSQELTIPSPFSFPAITEATSSKYYYSEGAEIQGINSGATINISGGEYSINGSTFTSDPGVIFQGQILTLRGMSPVGYGQSSQVDVTVGGVTESFNISTKAVDVNPEAIVFTDIVDADTNVNVQSELVTIKGINTPTTFTVTGGEFSVSGSAYSSGSGTISPGQTIRLRVFTSSAYETAVVASLDINGDISLFSVTTKQQPQETVPDFFNFEDVSGQPVSSPVDSNEVTLSGMAVPLVASILGGTYSVNGAAFTSQDVQVNNGDTVVLRVVTPAEGAAQNTLRFTVGPVTATWTVITEIPTIAPTTLLPDTPAAKVAWNIGDPSGELIPSAVVEYILTENGNNVYATTLKVFDYLLAQVARQVDERAYDVEVGYSKMYDNLKKLKDDYIVVASEENQEKNGSIVFFGGVNEVNNKTYRGNRDNFRHPVSLNDFMKHLQDKH